MASHPRTRSAGDQPELQQDEDNDDKGDTMTPETSSTKPGGSMSTQEKWKSAGRGFVEKIKTNINLPKRARKVLTGDEQRRIRDVIQEEFAKPQHVKLRDKLSFTIGVVCMLFTSHILTQHPQQFWAWYLFWVRDTGYSCINYTYVDGDVIHIRNMWCCRFFLS